MKNIDTISAIATPLGVGGIGIVRMSGDGAKDILSDVFECGCQQFEPRKMYLGQFVGEGFFDKCLAVYFQAPNSYTGEDVVEFHCHGGRTLIENVLKTTLKKGARLAENGEFTKRAFINGKLNLAESEAVIDMINAQSTAELNAKYNQLSGTLTKKVEQIQDKLTDIISGIEVVLDYPEEDIDMLSCEEDLQFIYNEICKLQRTYGVGGLIKSGVSVALVGKPNVGKSSLLNSLLGYNRAIVTSEAGTTRDTISESLEINGVKFNIIDTAGIRNSQNTVESLGINLSKESIKQSDLTLFVLDGEGQFDSDDLDIFRLLDDKKVIVICNKMDSAKYSKKHIPTDFNYAYIELSAKEGYGIEKLKTAMFDMVIGSNLTEGGCLLTNERHYGCIVRATRVCEKLLENLHDSMSDMIALELKSIWEILGEITGTTATEEIIHNIFMKFCLGK